MRQKSEIKAGEDEARANSKLNNLDEYPIKVSGYVFYGGRNGPAAKKMTRGLLEQCSLFISPFFPLYSSSFLSSSFH